MRLRFNQEQKIIDKKQINEIKDFLESQSIRNADYTMLSVSNINKFIDQFTGPNKWVAFVAISQHLEDSKYGQSVRYLWIHSEGDFDEVQFDSIWINHKRHLTANDFMVQEEIDEFNSMSDPLIIYRGCQEDTKEGVSWTTSIDIAREFARRAQSENCNQKGLIIKGECSKRDILAFFNHKNIKEGEIIIKTKNIRNIKIVEEISSCEND